MFSTEYKNAVFAATETDYENIEHYFNEEIPTLLEETDFKTTNSDTVPSRNYTIVIDAGHGGTDPGSIGYKTKVHEDKLNLEMSKKLEQKLVKAGFNVVMTRKDENALIEGKGKKWKRKEMEARRELIEKTRPNLIISLHQNSYTNHSLRGAQVFYDNKSEISKDVANSIQEQFKLNLDKSIKSPSPGDYFMLKCSSAPSVIVECGFLSHPEEEKLLQTDEYQDKIIASIYIGIVNFFQNKWFLYIFTLKRKEICVFLLVSKSLFLLFKLSPKINLVYLKWFTKQAVCANINIWNKKKLN